MSNETTTILVVDDNPVLVGILSEILSECGYNVRSASDGFTALAELRNGVPDILLSDLNMPGMSGFELLSIVRRRFPRIAVIAMSGAYLGDAIPSGIPADVFYAKGASSVARLVQIVATIRNEKPPPVRSAAPIWIPELFLDGLVVPVLFASCPECLRPFHHDPFEAGCSYKKERCPYCSMSIELSLIKPFLGIDRTTISAVEGPSGRGTCMQAVATENRYAK